MPLTKLRRTAAVVSLSAAAWLAACGGGTPQPVTPAQPYAIATGPKKPDEPVAPAVPPKTAADHHREFMGGCAKKAVNSPDYCECAWDEFRKVFTDDEMTAGDMPAPKLEKVKTQVLGACFE